MRLTSTNVPSPTRLMTPVDAGVTAEIADLYAWLPQGRYELIVASLPRVPVDPALQLSSHRPSDYWGRRMVDQVLAKLPETLASEGEH